MKARVTASIVLALGLTLGMSGCSLTAPQDTLHMQESSVGVGGTVGKVDVRNAVLITGSEDKVGNLVATFVNNEAKPHRIEVQHGGENLYVTVPAYGVKKIGGATGTRLLFTNLDAKAGALTDVFFTYGTQTGVTLSVPVLSSTFPGFEDYAPAR
ncbi:hypothetical protein GCM10027568_18360 [Humibacter soli]